jgi:DNA-directed RNA polymerase subunit RPC12/RpoP
MGRHSRNTEAEPPRQAVLGERDGLGKPAVQGERDGLGKPAVQGERDGLGKPAVLGERSGPPRPAARSEMGAAGQPPAAALPGYVKQVDCTICGTTKQLASATPYLYCDHCGALVDYDFWQANADTGADIANTVYHELVAQIQGELNIARARDDKERYCDLLTSIFRRWIRHCPQAVSPRAQCDPDFADQVAAYCAESASCREFEPSLAALDRQMNALIATLDRWPSDDGSWRAGEGIWRVAGLFKEQMERTYALLENRGVLAMDPDQAPPGVPLRMEYATFCQSWIPHLAPEDADRMLAYFELDGRYARVRVTGLKSRNCGGCGAEIATLPDAKAVICQACGRKLDIGGGATPCRTCGASLSLPVAASRVRCPYCRSAAHRL